MIEATVAELAARRRTDEDIAAMRDCLRRMDEALAAETDGPEIDDDFHLAIAAATHNQYVLRLSEFLGRQFSESRRMAWSITRAAWNRRVRRSANIFACSMRLPPVIPRWRVRQPMFI